MHKYLATKKAVALLKYLPLRPNAKHVAAFPVDGTPLLKDVGKLLHLSP